MFSGGDSSDGINSLNQCGAYGFVNQVAVSNAITAGQNIDWAQLAQQWIQMRDNSEMVAKSDSEVNTNKVCDIRSNNLRFEEKGEADMDMDDEEQSGDKDIHRITNNGTASTTVNNCNQPWFFGEGNSQIALRPSTNNHWNPWPNHDDVSKQNSINNRLSNPTSHIPSLLKMSVPHPNEIRVMPDIPNQSDANIMDAAKRKGLPAWIREGLEKMEREKQKQLEKAQEDKDTNLADELSDTCNTNLHSVPGTVLEDESTDNEEVVKMKKNLHSDNAKKDNEEDEYSSSEDKTYEQKLSEMMIVVRRTLTELLMEATNEEIAKVADETIKIFKSKASSAQVIRKSALSTLTDKLGLAAYVDSSSENDSDKEGSNSSKKAGVSETDNDSEEEIRNVIRVKRRAFLKTAEEIEERVAAAAAREEEKLKYFLQREEEEKERKHGKTDRLSVRDSSTTGHTGHNILKGYEKDFGEITERKIHINGKRQKDRNSRRERITRFSDNKDKYVAVPNAATFLSNLNSATTFASGSTTVSNTSNRQMHNIPDINGLLSNYASTGMTNALNAADAALEKALKGKSSSNVEKQSRRHERGRSYSQSKKRQRLSKSKHSRSRSKSNSSLTTSSSSSSSSDSNSSTSRSSHHSKYKYRSSKKHKSNTSAERKCEKLQNNNRSERKYSTPSYKRNERESASNRSHRHTSSDSDDDYNRRYRNDSSYSRKSSKSRSYASSIRVRRREHSRSQSKSYSSSNRRQ